MPQVSVSRHVHSIHLPPRKFAATLAHHNRARCTRRHALTVQALDLSGKWVKDKENSDLNAYSDMLSLLGLTGIRKTGALKLINAVVVEHLQEAPQFTVSYVSDKVAFLKSMEQFTEGRSVEMPRRDGQKGQQSATMTQDDTYVRTVVTWGQPNPGDLPVGFAAFVHGCVNLLLFGGHTASLLLADEPCCCSDYDRNLQPAAIRCTCHRGNCRSTRHTEELQTSEQYAMYLVYVCRAADHVHHT